MLLLLILFPILFFILLLLSSASGPPTRQVHIVHKRQCCARAGDAIVRLSNRRVVPVFFGGFLARYKSVSNQSMEAAMTLTPELKQAVEKAGDEPVRVRRSGDTYSVSGRPLGCLPPPARPH